MKQHNFNFDGGDILAEMGASWFVSYMYFDLIDSSHKNWKTVSYNIRIKYYNSSTNFHYYWLSKILEMNDVKLNTNKMDLKAQEIKHMANCLLDRHKEQFRNN